MGGGPNDGSAGCWNYCGDGGGEEVDLHFLIFFIQSQWAVNKNKNLNQAGIRINFQFTRIWSIPVFMITVCYMSITFGQMRTLLTIGNGFEDHDITSLPITRIQST